MATFYFIGGEDHDFYKIGSTTVPDTATTAARRTAYARCSLKIGQNNAISEGYTAPFGTNLTSLWLGARLYTSFAGGGNQDSNADLIAFYDGTIRRLMIGNDGGGSFKLRIIKQSAAGVRTVLATSGTAWAGGGPHQISVQVSSYGAAGTVNVYVNGLLWMTYTGDLTTDGATSLSGFHLGVTGGSNSIHYWSECVVSDSDTRAVNVVTLPPAANGNSWSWTNSYAAVDEVTLDETDSASSSSAGDIAQATVTSTGVTSSAAVVAVSISARAMKGGSGPSKADFGVRVGGVDYWSSDINLPASTDRIQYVWTTNPAGGNWAASDVTAAGFNIGIKSVT